MKIENVIKKFDQTISYACPKCKAIAAIQDNTLKCSNNHSYDFSKKGYIHLLPNYKNSKYHTKLFLARDAIFSKSYYKHILDSIITILSKEKFKHLIDVGCGEGYYIRNLKEIFLDCYFYGLDNSKEAITYATMSDKKNPYMLANLSNLPFSSSSIDIMLNILSPANYEEFFRVLKKDGFIIKIIPTANYLKEIREIFANTDYSNQETIDNIEKYCQIVDKIKVSKQFSLDYQDAENFLQMTPLTFSKTIGQAEINQLKQISVELDILLLRKK